VLLTALLPPLLADADIARTVRAASSRSRTDRSLVVAPGARPAVLAAMALGEEGVQRVAGGDAQLRLGALLVHPHLAAAQHLINAAFRQRRITLAQKIIEPLPGVIRRDRQKMNPGNIH